MSHHHDPQAADVERQYERGDLLRSILHALEASGKDLKHLSPKDLAPVDALHTRGREASVELGHLVHFSSDMQVLDVGSGLGGSARFLASSFGVQVTGIDLTHEFVDVARELTRLVGLDTHVEFFQGSALQLPFADSEFDVVWTEHAQMNIGDKHRFYSEISRVLKPGGRFVFHDIFRGDGDAPVYPLPWAERPEVSSLATPKTVRGLIESSGMSIRHWEDKTAASAEWFLTAQSKIGAAPLGVHLIMGASAMTKIQNVASGFQEHRLAVIQGVAEKI